MLRAHYIIRVGNEGIARTVSETAPNHWHYLSPQHIWGFPKRLKTVNVRAKFEADLQNPQVTVYIWFLSNSVGGPGRFVQVATGRRRRAQGPDGNGNLPIPTSMMVGLQQGFDHWFDWQPVSSDPAFHNQLRQIPVPVPHYISTLRRVLPDHMSFPAFQALIDGEERRVTAIQAGQPTALIQTAPPVERQAASTGSRRTVPRSARRVIEIDLDNLRREHIDPHAEGYIYLIGMKGTSFFKIGMSLDPEIRLRTLQTGNPQPLRIVRIQAVQDMRNEELGLHQQFDSQRVPNPNVREWFDFGDNTSDVMSAFRALRSQE